MYPCGRTRRRVGVGPGWRADCLFCCGCRWSHAGAGSDLPCRFASMISLRPFPGAVIAVVMTCVAASPSISDDAAPMPPFQAHVDMKTFMPHVLSPAAATIWKLTAPLINQNGEH